MAFDTLIDRSKEEAERTAVADAIRFKTGDHAPLDWPDGFRTAIGALGLSGEGASLDQVMDRTAVAVHAPSARNIPALFFARSPKLEKVRIPNVTNIGVNAFLECGALTDILFPKVEKIGQTAFDDNNLIGSYDFPEVRELGAQAFAHSTYVIKKMDFHKLEKVVGNKAFYATYIHAFIIRTGKLCIATYPVSLTNDTYVYVPKALLPDYLADTNWSNVAVDHIRAIEDYPEITGG